MATSRKRPASRNETRFVGPAQRTFDTFPHLAEFSLDTNCPDWRNYDRPESYVIPPLFYYKHSDKSDLEFERARAEMANLDIDQGKISKERPQEFNLVKDRGSDEAEHVVYKAIEKLIQEKAQAPFIAVQNLNISSIRHQLKDLLGLEWRELKASLTDCFKKTLVDAEQSQTEVLVEKFSSWLNNVLSAINANAESFSAAFDKVFQAKDFPSKCTIGHAKAKKAILDTFNSHFREYDFVLLGPKIGVIVLEVKHSSFTRKKDFTPTKGFLPDQYAHGLHQLKSFDYVIDFLQENTHIEIGKTSVRKILFTPNLEKKRFFGWYATLDPSSKEIIDQQVQNASELWFHEDIDSGTASVYRSLRKLLQTKVDVEMRKDVYEAYCPLIVGLASITTFPDESFGISEEKLSEGEALIRESYRIETHDPSKSMRLPEESTVGATISKRQKTENIVQSNVIKLDKAIILTPEQKAALEGPCRQYIIGAAGTGKTIILQAKALELLKKGESVFIFCPPWFAPKYKEIFAYNSFTNYEICSCWADLARGLHPGNEADNVKNLTLEAYKQAKMIIEGATEPTSLKSTKAVEVLSKFDGLLIDDMADRYGWRKKDEEGTFPMQITNITSDVFFSLLVMAIGKRIYPSKVIWVAFDYWTDHIHNYFFPDYMKNQHQVEKFLTSDSDNSVSVENYYTLTKLNRVMRCPENVFRAAFSFDDQCRPTVKPYLRHKIQGRWNRTEVPCRDLYESIHVSWVEIKKKLDQLSAKKISFDNVCLVLGSSWDFLSPETFCFKKCEEDGILARVLASHDPLEFRQTSPARPSTHEGILTITVSDEVSSSEWPIVIFVSYRDDDKFVRYTHYLRYDYRARSRATAELIEIIAVRSSTVPKRQRRFSDSLASQLACMDTRRIFRQSEVKQLKQTAGSTALLAHLASRIDWITPPLWFSRSEDNRDQLWRFARRRSYTVSDISLDKTHKLHPDERK